MLEIVVQNFVKNFVQKERRDRATLLLSNPKKRVQFTDKLNHQWDTILDMRWITQIPRGSNDYEFAKQELKLSGKESCTIISNHEEIDGLEKNFEDAFDAVYGRGFGSIILIGDGNKMYLETEVIQGSQNRFIGKKGPPIHLD